MANMANMTSTIIAFSVLGFAFFVYNLESPDMGNIIFRNGQFAPWNLVEYIVSPFKQDVLWYPQLWAANWIITTSVGGLVGLLLSILIHLWAELTMMRMSGSI